jgi:quinol monooxygenase YgiN
MVIVGGTFEFDPNQRDAFLASRFEMMRASRAEPGCIEYTFAADPIDASRVVLYERWASQEHLDTHLAVVRAKPQTSDDAVTPIASAVVIYEVSGERRLA